MISHPCRKIQAVRQPFHRRACLLATAAFVAATAATAGAHAQDAPLPLALDPVGMTAVATVDDRYQSYNIEMVEVMGGRWWAPYSHLAAAQAAAAGGQKPTAIGSGALEARAPIDLANPQLKRLAAALGPAYVRVSDAWANTAYFDPDASPGAKPPPGFGGVLTGAEWRGVIDFANAVDAKIVTTFSIGPGVRDPDGVWTPVEAKKILDFTKSAGGDIAAAEFFNEPNLAAMEGAPKGYDAAAYGRDFKVFEGFIRQQAPGLKLIGPGSVGENEDLGAMRGGLKSADMLAASGPGLDAISYHFYGAFSLRCKALGAAFQTSPAQALSSPWLDATNRDAAFYGALRDRFEPGKPLWLSETADAACGGNPWASDFADSFRYINQLGTLARHGVSVTMHNTLIGSDYGLIDDQTLAPRPNYWSAVLWRRLMGVTVLDPHTAALPANLHLYAQCLRGQPGGVAVLALNADHVAARTLSVSRPVVRYTLSADALLDSKVKLNGVTLALKPDGGLPDLTGAKAARGAVKLAPETITFLAIPKADVPACR